MKQKVLLKESIEMSPIWGSILLIMHDSQIRLYVHLHTKKKITFKHRQSSNLGWKNFITKFSFYFLKKFITAVYKFSFLGID